MEQKFYVFSAQSYSRLQDVYRECKQDFQRHLFFRSFPSLQFALSNPFSEKAFADLLDAVRTELVDLLVAVHEKGRVLHVLRSNGTEFRDVCTLQRLTILLRDRRRGIPDTKTLHRAFDQALKEENFLHLSERARNYIMECFRARRNCAITNRLGYADLISEVVTGYRIEELRQPTAGHNLRLHEWVLEFDKPQVLPPAPEMQAPAAVESAVEAPPPARVEAAPAMQKTVVRSSLFSLISAACSLIVMVMYGLSVQKTGKGATREFSAPGAVTVLLDEGITGSDFPTPGNIVVVVKGCPVYMTLPDSQLSRGSIQLHVPATPDFSVARLPGRAIRDHAATTLVSSIGY